MWCRMWLLVASGIRCVFFSLIGKAKGADLVLEAVTTLPEVGFHFYGRIEKGFESHFRSLAFRLPNVEYHGVFDSVTGDVLAELNRYDLHLLPTRWPNEGVPGVLVETKMAAVPSVVSDCCHSAEIVVDGVDGVVLKTCDAESHREAIARLCVDSSRIDAMKVAALESAERFYIDRYLDLIVSEIAA